MTNFIGWLHVAFIWTTTIAISWYAEYAMRGLSGSPMFYSNGNPDSGGYGLFPIVTLSSGRIIATNTANEFEYTPAN